MARRASRARDKIPVPLPGGSAALTTPPAHPRRSDVQAPPCRLRINARAALHQQCEDREKMQVAFAGFSRSSTGSVNGHVRASVGSARARAPGPN